MYDLRKGEKSCCSDVWEIPNDYTDGDAEKKAKDFFNNNARILVDIIQRVKELEKEVAELRKE